MQNPDVAGATVQMIGEYGLDASVAAFGRAANMLEDCDCDGYVIWSRIWTVIVSSDANVSMRR